MEEGQVKIQDTNITLKHKFCLDSSWERNYLPKWLEIENKNQIYIWKLFRSLYKFDKCWDTIDNQLELIIGQDTKFAELHLKAKQLLYYWIIKSKVKKVTLKIKTFLIDNLHSELSEIYSNQLPNDKLPKIEQLKILIENVIYDSIMYLKLLLESTTPKSSIIHELEMIETDSKSVLEFSSKFLLEFSKSKYE